MSCDHELANEWACCSRKTPAKLPYTTNIALISKGKIEQCNMPMSAIQTTKTINFSIHQFCIYLLLLKISHLISCCNELKLLLSIFTLVEVKKGTLICHLNVPQILFHALSSMRKGVCLLQGSLFVEGERLK